MRLLALFTFSVPASEGDSVTGLVPGVALSKLTQQTVRTQSCGISNTPQREYWLVVPAAGAPMQRQAQVARKELRGAPAAQDENADSNAPVGSSWKVGIQCKD